MSQDDILEAIRAAVGAVPHDPGLTVGEYAAREGVTKDSARNVLEKGVREGKLHKGRCYRRRENGSSYPVPVYRAA